MLGSLVCRSPFVELKIECVECVGEGIISRPVISNLALQGETSCEGIGFSEGVGLIHQIELPTRFSERRR